MKKLIPLFLLSLFLNQSIHAQNYFPVPTTGYTLDAVAENTTALATTSGVLDGGGHVFYSQAYAQIVSSLFGLPNNGIISSATRTFQLQSYTAANALYLPNVSQADTLTLLTPAAFSTLSLLGFATESNGSMSVTVRFTDNSSQVFPAIAVNDWFTAVNPFASGFDRLTRATGVLEAVGGAGNPRFFAHDLAISCANQSKQVKRIIIKNTSVAQKIAMWAVAGVSIPLTATSSVAGLCNSGTAQLMASGQTSYTWLPAGSFAGSNNGTITVSPPATTEYTVQSITAQNCTLNAMVTVNIYFSLPTLTIVNTANAGGICPTTTINLTATGAVTYTWAGGSATVTNGIAFAPTTGDSYTVSGENSCGISTAVTSVSIHPLPTLNPAASASTLCAGTSLTLTAAGNATTYVWSGGPNVITSGVGFVPSTGNFTYSVIGTSALSCTALATIPVTVYATPNAVPVANPPLGCIGNSVTLTASGALSYTWSSSTQTVIGNPQFTLTPVLPGVTSYTVMKANSTCVDTKVISITTNSLPAISAVASPTQVCALRPATLVGSGGISYTWTAPGGSNFTGNNPVVYPAASSVYSVAASDGTCINRSTVPVSALANPTITTSASSPSICVGQQVTVSAFGGNSYTWTAISGTFYTASVTDSPTTNIAYAVTGNNASGCTTSTQQIVLVSPSPVISIAVSMPLVCSGDPSTLTATGAISYTWDASAGGSVSNAVVVHPASLTSDVINYSVNGSYPSTGCQSSQTIQVSVYVPELSVSGTTIACRGGQISLTGDGGDANTYSWHTGTGTFNFQAVTTTLLAPAIFTLAASSTSNGVNCPVTQTVAVAVYANPTITATAERAVICQKESVHLFAGGGVSYSWSNAMTSSSITVSPIVAINNYTVTGTDANGCVGTGIVQVTVSPCTGIEGLPAGNSGITIYPNPNNGEFIIRADAYITLMMTNELGEVVRNISLSQEHDYRVSVSDLPVGIYFLSGKTGTNSFNRKVVVTK